MQTQQTHVISCAPDAGRVCACSCDLQTQGNIPWTPGECRPVLMHPPTSKCSHDRQLAIGSEHIATRHVWRCVQMRSPCGKLLCIK